MKIDHLLLSGMVVAAAVTLSGCGQDPSRDHSAAAADPERDAAAQPGERVDGANQDPLAGYADSGDRDTGIDEARTEPLEDVREAADVLRRLKEQEPALADRLGRADGVFIVPDYATAALLVGGSGGEGVLLRRQDDGWSNPGFYDIGSIDIGAQAGAAGGSIVMLLMSDAAVQSFRAENDFSLMAQAGLTVLNWSAEAPAASDDGDVIVWSDTVGLLGEASVGFGGISWDAEEANAYYQREVGIDEVLDGRIDNPNEPLLRSEFAEFSVDEPGEPAREPTD